MSNIYNLEPVTKGKVLLTTTHGDIEIELWAREVGRNDSPVAYFSVKLSETAGLSAIQYLQTFVNLAAVQHCSQFETFLSLNHLPDKYFISSSGTEGM